MALSRSCAISLVVPTRNEAPNISTLISRTAAALGPMPADWELIFVDDSDDDTPAAIEQLIATSEVNVRLLHRSPSERIGGLGGAVQAGFGLARGSVLAVMDADLQHPPEVLPTLIAPVLRGEADLCAGTRYGGAGTTTGLDGHWRRVVSSGCRWLAHLAVPASRSIEDPLSGLFALHRSVVNNVRLRPDGYKILLEVVARGNWDRVANVEYQFAPRFAGSSKAGLREGLVFFRLLSRLARARRVRFTEPAPQMTMSGLNPAVVVERAPGPPYAASLRVEA